MKSAALACEVVLERRVEVEVVLAQVGEQRDVERRCRRPGRGPARGCETSIDTAVHPALDHPGEQRVARPAPPAWCGRWGRPRHPRGSRRCPPGRSGDRRPAAPRRAGRSSVVLPLVPVTPRTSSRLSGCPWTAAARAPRTARGSGTTTTGSPDAAAAAAARRVGEHRDGAARRRPRREVGTVVVRARAARRRGRPRATERESTETPVDLDAGDARRGPSRVARAGRGRPGLRRGSSAQARDSRLRGQGGREPVRLRAASRSAGP